MQPKDMKMRSTPFIFKKLHKCAATLAIALPLLLCFASNLAAQTSYTFVANNFSNSVSVINAATRTLFATIPVGSVPTELAITPNNQYLIVTNQFGGTVSLVSTGQIK